MANGSERYSKKTRRAEFPEEMEQVVPWEKLCALIELTISHQRRYQTKLIHTAVVTPAGERGECHGAAGAVARRRDEGVGRPSVSRTERGDSGTCAASAQRRYRFKNHVDELARAKNRTNLTCARSSSTCLE